MKLSGWEVKKQNPLIDSPIRRRSVKAAGVVVLLSVEGIIERQTEKSRSGANGGGSQTHGPRDAALQAPFTYGRIVERRAGKSRSADFPPDVGPAYCAEFRLAADANVLTWLLSFLR